MTEYMYALAMLPTHFNREEFDLMADRPQLLFTDPRAAADHAIEQEWWPFVVERIEVRR